MIVTVFPSTYGILYAGTTVLKGCKNEKASKITIILTIVGRNLKIYMWVTF